MCSFGLQNSCHPESRRARWWSCQGWHGRPPCRHPKAPPSYSAWSSKLPPSCSPDMINNIHIWRLSWPSLKDLDLLIPEKLHSWTWGMARSSILLKIWPLLLLGMYWEARIGWYLAQSTLQISLAPPYWMLPPNHKLSTSKVFWVNRGSRQAAEGCRHNWRRSTDDSSEN